MERRDEASQIRSRVDSMRASRLLDNRPSNPWVSQTWYIEANDDEEKSCHGRVSCGLFKKVFYLGGRRWKRAVKVAKVDGPTTME